VQEDASAQAGNAKDIRERVDGCLQSISGVSVNSSGGLIMD